MLYYNPFLQLVFSVVIIVDYSDSDNSDFPTVSDKNIIHSLPKVSLSFTSYQRSEMLSRIFPRNESKNFG